MGRIIFFSTKTVAFIFLAASIPSAPCAQSARGPSSGHFSPNRLACPVTPNLFPKAETSDQVLKFTFTENLGAIPASEAAGVRPMARRISITATTEDHREVEIEFIWTSAEFEAPLPSWGRYSGMFSVKCDGMANCFFLENMAGLPGNIPCKEFQLRIPAGVEITNVAFSSLPSEIPVLNCPMPRLENVINDLLGDCRAHPQDRTRAARLMELMEQATSRYDCRRTYDPEPIPAWWMADYRSSNAWVAYLHDKVQEEDPVALRVYVKFFSTSDGYIAEGMSMEIWQILDEHALFILENWDCIKDHKESIFGARYLQSPESNEEMIGLFRAIGYREEKYRAICREIIECLEKRITR